MPIKITQTTYCDICSKEYNQKDVSVTEYSGEIVEAIKISGYYKPDSQCINRYICRACSNSILKLIENLKAATK